MKGFLILGGTGTIGSEVVRQLTQLGKQVQVLTRSEEKPQLPKGATGIVGDLLNPADYPRIFSGAKKYFCLTPLLLPNCTKGWRSSTKPDR